MKQQSTIPLHIRSKASNYNTTAYPPTPEKSPCQRDFIEQVSPKFKRTCNLPLGNGKPSSITITKIKRSSAKNSSLASIESDSNNIQTNIVKEIQSKENHAEKLQIDSANDNKFESEKQKHSNRSNDTVENNSTLSNVIFLNKEDENSNKEKNINMKALTTKCNENDQSEEDEELLKCFDLSEYQWND